MIKDLLKLLRLSKKPIIIETVTGTRLAGWIVAVLDDGIEFHSDKMTYYIYNQNIVYVRHMRRL